MHPYEQQLDRTRRWFAKFKQINDGMEPTLNSDNYIDDALAFFMFCYHVKDYLKADPAFTMHSGQEVEEYITKTPALALCADLCNGLKHLTLKNARSGSEPKVGGRVFDMKLGDNLSGPDPASTMAIKIKIEHHGKILDAFEIATEAMAAWESFVK